MAELKDNAIQWYTGDDFVSVTLSQRKYINKVRKMAERWPNLVVILHENDDGSIFARLPLKAVKLSIITYKEEGESDGCELEAEGGEV